MITIRTHYLPPAGRTGPMVLRTSQDWEANISASRVSNDGTVHEFDIHAREPFLYYKPLLNLEDGPARWSVGHNYLALASASTAYDIYPHFDEDQGCSACDLRELKCAHSGVSHQYRVFYPPGYEENTLKRYPVLYMQDGQNLFFPEEAFGGAHWRVRETLGLLSQMNLIDRVIVVGIYPHDRMRDYTQPGYETYGRFLIDTLKPAIDDEFRTLPGRDTTAVMGSSLGGVVSFYLAWQHPDVFGRAACLSSTFGYRDDLFARVANEPRPSLRLYLDTGWPQDNFEVARTMRTLLAQRGFQEGMDLMYFAFPEGRHNEASWATRLHIPFQFLFGKRPVVSSSVSSFGPADRFSGNR